MDHLGAACWCRTSCMQARSRRHFVGGAQNTYPGEVPQSIYSIIQGLLAVCECVPSYELALIAPPCTHLVGLVILPSSRQRGKINPKAQLLQGSCYACSCLHSLTHQPVSPMHACITCCAPAVQWRPLPRSGRRLEGAAQHPRCQRRAQESCHSSADE